MSGGVILLLAVAAVAVWLLSRPKRKPSQSGVAFIVRAKPPASHTLQNLAILAGLIGLAWFFWWVTHTKILDLPLPG